MTHKAMQTIIRYERAAQDVSSLTHRIGRAIDNCPISRSYDGRDSLPVDDAGRVKTHLWQAFRLTQPSSCGWGYVHLDEDGIREALGEHGSHECSHCREAFELIQLRKKARQEFGIAKRAIRTIGRAALKKLERQP